MKRILAAALLMAASVSSASAVTTYQSFRCSNSTILRVIFDDEARTATVVPFARPSIRLTRVVASNGDSFRYVRRNTHELRGSSEQVVWRVGRAEWTCRRGT